MRGLTASICKNSARTGPARNCCVTDDQTSVACPIAVVATFASSALASPIPASSDTAARVAAAEAAAPSRFSSNSTTSDNPATGRRRWWRFNLRTNRLHLQTGYGKASNRVLDRRATNRAYARRGVQRCADKLSASHMRFSDFSAHCNSIFSTIEHAQCIPAHNKFSLPSFICPIFSDGPVAALQLLASAFPAYLQEPSAAPKDRT